VGAGGPPAPPHGHAPYSPIAKNADVLAAEKRVSDALGLVVTIDHGDSGGVVSIRYRKLDQLDEVLRRLEKK